MGRKLTDRRLYWRGSTIWCRVLGPDGRTVRKSTGCASEQAARAQADHFERCAVDPDYAASSTTTFGDALMSYLQDLERRGSAEATIKIARQKLGHFVRLWGADLRLAKVNAARVNSYRDQRKTEGVKPYTIVKEIGQLRQVLKIARHLGTFLTQIDRVLPPYMEGSYEPRNRWPTPEEVAELSKHLEPRRFAHLAFILSTGARRSESDRAERSDVNNARGVVALRGTKTAASQGEIPITEVSRPLLEWALAQAPNKKATGPLFDPWAKLNRDLRAACVRAGIPPLSPNDLRRGMARWHKLAGVNNETVSKLLRHTTDKLVQTTYANLGAEEVGQLAARQMAAVSILYAATAASGANGGQPAHEVAGNPARPTGVEPVTRGLEGRESLEPSTSQNRRSIGNRLAHARRRSVPNLYRPFPLAEATANLYELLSAAGGVQ